ncbi:somatoliberin [Callorhinchus milii]|uniref:somatoliberin n=1 Tax=Callorhinchus milii TaxID=7868 RepID=UPI001C3F6F9C|nr:somatoliberin [Callorhinchus milii]
MLDKATWLVLCCLTAHTLCSPVHPAFRLENKSIPGRGSPVLAEESGSVGLRADCQEIASALDSTPKRTERHADAIFTNSYRKVLGQISARKFLQSIMGKRLGDEEDLELAKRNADGLLTDIYTQYLHQQQMVIRKYLAAVLGSKSFEDVNREQLPEDIAAVLEKDYGTKPIYGN